MRTIAMILIAGITAGCASVESKWKNVDAGQTKDEVVSNIGTPDVIFAPENGHGQTLEWKMGEFTACWVMLSVEGDKVQSKDCYSDSASMAEAQQARAAVLQTWLQGHPAQATYTPMKVYAPERPVQTTCTPGGFGSVNCTSRQTGVDTSIYNH